MEKPTFPLWKRRHASLAASNPEEYAAKHDTRKAYQWIVLTYLRYDSGLMHQQQWTWPQPFVPSSGPRTAWGVILGTWELRGRNGFLVEACDKRKRDTYKVIFAKDGTFITAISVTRKDAKEQNFPLGRRAAAALLRLNERVPDLCPRHVTREAVAAILSPQSAKFAKKSEAVWNIYLPRAARVGLVTEGPDGPCFSYSMAETRRQLLLSSAPN